MTALQSTASGHLFSQSRGKAVQFLRLCDATLVLDTVLRFQVRRGRGLSNHLFLEPIPPGERGARLLSEANDEEERDLEPQVGRLALK